MADLPSEKGFDLRQFLTDFVFEEHPNLLGEDSGRKTQIESIEIDGVEYPRYINEFWTSKQRQASALHEISYRACFKPQLPRFFIELLTQRGDMVYDPFSGRGTVVIEAALLGRSIVANDVNPIGEILSSPRLNIPRIPELEARLNEIPGDENARAEIDLSMFYHPRTESEIVSLKNYLKERKERGEEDHVDSWIRMVATNRLTGHSSGFFSVYTLPPNQAVQPENQRRINERRNQKPEYRDTRKLISKKSGSLIRGISGGLRDQLRGISRESLFLTEDARCTDQIEDESIQLTVTSPPFLDVVQYAGDNWLRGWFNGIDAEEVSKKITMARTIDDWCTVMEGVFKELYRMTKRGGWVAFEVGEVKNGRLRLDEYVVPLGLNAGFTCEGILINRQSFTKTSNIWGIRNNSKGTNSNRVAIFYRG